MMTRFKYRKEFLRTFRYLKDLPYIQLENFFRNRRFESKRARFLVLHHPYNNPYFFDVILDWAALHVPEVRALFEMHAVPGLVINLKRFSLQIQWLQDPVQSWSKIAYMWARFLSYRCSRQGIPVINSADRLLNAGKFEGAKRMASVGIRVPQMKKISHPKNGTMPEAPLKFPFFIRENWGHGGEMLLIKSPEDWASCPLKRFKRPIAVEFIDVKDADGLYRKYRYLVAGSTGVSLSLHICKDWIVRGEKCLYETSGIAEETRFISTPSPHHELFSKALKALDLDFVAFDFSYTKEGELVVWEANPFPYLHFSRGIVKYRWPATTRAIAALLKLYLDKARYEVPNEIQEILRMNSDVASIDVAPIHQSQIFNPMGREESNSVG